MKVWILTGRTESGDDVGPFVFSHNPTDDEQLEVLKKTYPSDFEMSEEELEEYPFGYISKTSVEECEVITR
ncbi:hypothetical protein [Rhizobium sp. CECT 9324]|uniref:hypothetical protein n=1 Tax=Rhizobium sp. CECT 9324 TaxID=2845820 RepID=UPI001E3A0DF7|nr:hypothetical protein [Rhizobium sp. CECT 9324]CAH0343733.1 hypothetical protein RHI9324_05470 [Rhizobium sp. CECT 9324]